MHLSIHKITMYVHARFQADCSRGLNFLYLTWFVGKLVIYFLINFQNSFVKKQATFEQFERVCCYHKPSYRGLDKSKS